MSTELGAQVRVYSVTTLYAAAEAFEKDVPFQVAIVEFSDGSRKTVRIQGTDVEIDDEVEARDERDGILFFGKGQAP